MTIKTQKEHFLNDEQKQIKSEVIGELLEFFGNRITKESEKFNQQSFSDMLLSVLITFTRESFFRFIKECAIDNKVMRQEVINEIMATIKKELIAQFNNDDKMKH